MRRDVLYLALTILFVGCIATASSGAAVSRCTTTIRTIISTVTSTLISTVTVTEPAMTTAPTTTAPTTTDTTATTTTSSAPVCTATLTAGAGMSLSSFVSSLQPGDTGCLSGAFTGDLTVTNAGFTLQPVEGSTASINGCLWLKNTADQVTLRSLSLRSSGSCFSVVLGQGDGTLFDHVDVDGGGLKNCMLFGYGTEADPANSADDVTVASSRIHGCGDDSHEHGIYAEFTRRLYVVDTFIYGAGGGGIQFYPDADDSLLEYDVISDNDLGTGYAWNVLFGSALATGEYTTAHQSERNVIIHSLVTFTSPGVSGQNIDSYWPGLVGLGNEVAFSCVFSPGDVNFKGVGYSQHDNIQADPLYVDEAGRDYTLAAGSPCAGLGPR